MNGNFPHTNNTFSDSCSLLGDKESPTNDPEILTISKAANAA